VWPPHRLVSSICMSIRSIIPVVENLSGECKCHGLVPRRCDTRIDLLISLESVLTSIHNSISWHMDEQYIIIILLKVSTKVLAQHLEHCLTIRGCTQKFPDWPPEARTAIRCSCIAILWVSLVSFVAIILCVASQRVFIFVNFFIDSVRKLLDTPSYMQLSLAA
jgi:hypothetical protein